MIAEPAHLEQMLGRLKLTAIRDQLDSLLDEAAKGELTLRETLTLFCEREIARKDERRIEMAMSIAKFPYVRDLAGFDFKAQPSLDPKQIRDLATCRFIANGEMLLLLGPPGVGKTHLAVALGRAAILAGYAVLFIQATTLVATLARAHGEGRLEDKLTQFAKPRLLIVDELGYLPFEPDAAHLFFQLVSRRYERGSLLITSNRAIGEWGTVFGDPVVATAILDRLLHHSHVVTIRGDSYRLREKRRSGLLKPAGEPRTLAPERFQDTQLRTVQRAVKAWRARSARAIILGGMATPHERPACGSDGRAFGVAHSSTGATTTTTPTIDRMADPKPTRARARRHDLPG
jgi:DNA replication protein DnaC